MLEPRVRYGSEFESDLFEVRKAAQSGKPIVRNRRTAKVEVFQRAQVRR